MSEIVASGGGVFNPTLMAAIADRLPNTETRHRQAVLVPVDRLDRSTLRTVEYARTISPNVTAMHITDDLDQGQRLRSQWESAVLDVPLVIIDSPYRSFVTPVVSYIDALDRATRGSM